MTLNSLKSFAIRKKKRVGRGIGSGLGKTSGRGHKGQKARTSVGVFGGGQNPITQMFPKRGFISCSRYKKTYAIITTGKLQEACDRKLIDPKKDVITVDFCEGLSWVSKDTKRIKILFRGALKAPLKVRVYKVSEQAQSAINAVGGSCECQD